MPKAQNTKIIIGNFIAKTVKTEVLNTYLSNEKTITAHQN